MPVMTKTIVVIGTRALAVLRITVLSVANINPPRQAAPTPRTIQSEPDVSPAELAVVPLAVPAPSSSKATERTSKAIAAMERRHDAFAEEQKREQGGGGQHDPKNRRQGNRQTHHAEGPLHAQVAGQLHGQSGEHQGEQEPGRRQDGPAAQGSDQEPRPDHRHGDHLFDAGHPHFVGLQGRQLAQADLAAV